jgi:hypothetical protein
MIMRDEEYQRLKETAWRRALSPAEEAALQEYLAAHAEAREAWTEEAALNRVLQRWLAPPVSSNFTARVLQAVQQNPKRHALSDWFAPSQWFPEGRAWRVAMCCTMACVGVLSFHETQTFHRARLAREMAGVSALAAVPRMDWLKDFDTINKMSKVKVADDDLLAALQ